MPIAQVFISWSGPVSQQIATETKNFITKLHQGVKIFFSPNDLEKGTKWDIELHNQLSSSSIGIICLTKENLDSKWISYEAGLIASKLEKSRICPVLVGVTDRDVAGPLSTFQMTGFEKSDFYKIVSLLHKYTNSEIEEAIVKELFDELWEKYQKKINEILAAPSTSKVKSRTTEDILEELLQLARKTNNDLSTIQLDYRYQQILRTGFETPKLPKKPSDQIIKDASKFRDTLHLFKVLASSFQDEYGAPGSWNETIMSAFVTVAFANEEVKARFKSQADVYQYVVDNVESITLDLAPF